MGSNPLYKAGAYLESNANPIAAASLRGLVQGGLSGIPSLFGYFLKGMDMAAGIPVAAAEESLATLQGNGQDSTVLGRYQNRRERWLQDSLLEKYFFDEQGNVDVNENISNFLDPVLGRKEKIIERGGRPAEIASGLSEFGGSLAAGFGLGAGGSFGTQAARTGVASKRILDSIVEGAKVGAISSLPSGLGASYDSTTQSFDPIIGAAQIGLGTALGGAIPAGIGFANKLSQGGNTLKQALKASDQRVSESFKRSDNWSIARQINERNMINQSAANQYARAKQLNEQPLPQPAEPGSQQPPQVQVSEPAPPQGPVRRPNIQPAGEQQAAQLARRNQLEARRQAAIDTQKITPTVKKLQKRMDQLDKLQENVNPDTAASKMVEKMRSKVIAGLDQSRKSQAARNVKSQKVQSIDKEISELNKVLDQVDEQGITLAQKLKAEADTQVYSETAANNAAKNPEIIIEAIDNSPLFEGITNYTARKGLTQTVVTPIQNKIDAISNRLGRQLSEFKVNYLRAPKKVFQEINSGLEENAVKYNYDNATIIKGPTNQKNSAVYNFEEGALTPEFKELVLKQQAPLLKYYNDLIEMGVKMPDLVDGVYIPRKVKDVKGLLNYLSKKDNEIRLAYENTIAKGKGQLDLGDDVLIGSLLKSRSVDKMTPEMAEFYHSPYDSMKLKTGEIGKQTAIGKFFDNNLKGDVVDLVTQKVQSVGDFKSPESILIAQENLQQMFLPFRNNDLMMSVKKMQSFVTLGGWATAVRQSAQAPTRYANRFDPISTLKGLISVSGSPLNNKAIGLEMLNDIEFSNNNVLQVLDKYLMLPAFHATNNFELNLGLNTSYHWLVDQSAKALRSGKVSGNFKTFLQRRYTPEKSNMIIQKLGSLKGKKLEGLDSDVVDASFQAAIDRGGLVLSKADKVGASQDVGGLAGWLYNLRSWQLKNANVISDSVLGEAKRGNVGTAARNLAYYTFVETMGSAFVEAFVIKEGLQGIGQTASDFGKEWAEITKETSVPLYNSYLIDQVSDPQNLGEVLGTGLIPGAATSLRLVEDTAQLASEGDIAGIFDPNINQSFKYMPPRLISEPLYYGSEEAGRDRASRYTRELPFEKKRLELKNEREAIKRGLDPSQANTVRGKTAKRYFDQDKSAIQNAGTVDPEKAAKIKGLKKLTEKIELELESDLLKKLRNKEITAQEAKDLYENKDGFIQSQVMQAMKEGQI